MRIVHLSDIHGDLKYLIKAGPLIAGADLTAVSGDLTHFGTVSQAEEILSSIAEINPNIAAVPGNCDHPDTILMLKQRGFYPGSGCSAVCPGFTLAGLDGALKGPMDTPLEHDEAYYSKLLDSIEESGNPEIIISHQPPYGSVADRAGLLRHVGSTALAAYIKKRQPLLCLTGHIHESPGAEYLEGCLVVNPGPFRSGRLAVIETGEGCPTVSIMKL